MKVAIMQPYFLPYIGYFQLINTVDIFVVYDNIEYTKKGWINRNRILVNNKPEYISLPIKKASDFLNVRDRYLSDNWFNERVKLKNKIKESYRKAPYYSETIQILDKIFDYKDINLFNFIYHSLKTICNHLDIETPLIVSSSIDYDNSLKSQEKVLDICKSLKTEVYINPIGGVDLYDKSTFFSKGIDIKFLRSDNVTYTQFNKEFISSLSIIDVLMFNDLKTVKHVLLNQYITK